MCLIFLQAQARETNKQLTCPEAQAIDWAEYDGTAEVCREGIWHDPMGLSPAGWDPDAE